MLVKIITEIDAERMKEIRELKKTLKIYRNLLYKTKCSIESCEAYAIANTPNTKYIGEATFVKCQSMYECSYCRYPFCEQHVTEFPGQHLPFHVCAECLKDRHHL